MLASVRASFREGLCPVSPNADLNARIASSILACFQGELFDSTGLLRSLWLTRLANVTAPHAVFVDGIRLVRMETEEDFGVRRIATSFDAWNPRDPLAERCRFGPGGRLVHDWKTACTGEACVEVRGDNSQWQYPLWISHITVQAGVQYDVAVHYRTTEGLDNSRAVMLIYFFRDDRNQDVGQERLYLSGARQWTKAKRMVTPPEGTVRMDVGFRLAYVGPEQRIFLDNLRFEQRPSAALLELSIDPVARRLAAPLVTWSTQNSRPWQRPD
jgi:hypothetical protein